VGPVLSHSWCAQGEPRYCTPRGGREARREAEPGLRGWEVQGAERLAFGRGARHVQLLRWLAAWSQAPVQQHPPPRDSRARMAEPLAQHRGTCGQMKGAPEQDKGKEP